MATIALAVEDSLSEAVGIRLVNELGSDFEVGLVFRKGGFGYLKSNIEKFCELAARTTVLMIADLDRKECAPTLIRDWMKKKVRPKGLLFRVAVTEIESWLLADHVAMRGLLGAQARIPANPDSLADPKQALLTLARNAPRDVRRDLLPQGGALASQGLGYNQRLESVVNSDWNPARAADRSDSLRRTRISLSKLTT